MLVLNNGDLNQVTWEQRVLAGDAKMPTTQDLPPFDVAAYARQLGLEGIRVETPARSRRPGSARSVPTGRSCSTS